MTSIKIHVMAKTLPATTQPLAYCLAVGWEENQKSEKIQGLR